MRLIAPLVFPDIEENTPIDLRRMIMRLLRLLGAVSIQKKEGQECVVGILKLGETLLPFEFTYDETGVLDIAVSLEPLPSSYPLTRLALADKLEGKMRATPAADGLYNFAWCTRTHVSMIYPDERVIYRAIELTVEELILLGRLYGGMIDGEDDAVVAAVVPEWVTLSKDLDPFILH